MTSRDFCYWLQGYFELRDGGVLNSAQVESISKHLALVFMHEIDPGFGGPKVQQRLNDIHGKGHEKALIRC